MLWGLEESEGIADRHFEDRQAFLIRKLLLANL